MELAMIFTVQSVLILVCLLSSKLSSWLNMPCLLLFLGVGMMAGSEGLGGLPFDNPKIANYIGSGAMAFILFSGGFDTSWKSVKSVLVPGSLLSTIGVFLSALFVGLFTWFFLGWLLPDSKLSLAWCLLLGSIISSTDAAAVFSILRSRNVSLSNRLHSLLEFESGSNDPMAAFLTIFMVGVVVAESATGKAVSFASFMTILPMFAIKMSIGLVVGFLIGRLMVMLYNRIDFEYDGLYYVLGIVAVLLSFAVAELLYGNGFMAVYVAGMTMGSHRFVFHNGVGKFHDGVAWLMQVVLFTILGLLVSPSHVWQVKWTGLLIAAFLMLVARPLAVFICMYKSKFNFKERLLVSWVGLRGGAPIMLATFPLMAQITEDDLMFHIVFFIVLTSVLLQGMTLMPMARLLHLDYPLAKRTRAPISFEHTGLSDTGAQEFTVNDATAGKKLSELNLPKGALVVMIRRDGSYIIPGGATTVIAGDALMIAGSDKILDQTTAVLPLAE